MKTKTPNTRTRFVVLSLCLSVVAPVAAHTPKVQPLKGAANPSIPDLFSNLGLTPPAEHSAQPLSANYAPPTPEQQARAEQAAKIGATAFYSLKAGHYAEAEREVRESLSLNPDDGRFLEVLASALEAQEKDQEALKVYRTMAVDARDDRLIGQTRILLPYALLLLKSGQWEKAVVAYNTALPNIPDVGFHFESPVVHDGDVIRANSHFSIDVPEPTALAAAIHIARGITYNSECDADHGSQNHEAMREYEKALQLAPSSDLANYYYGVGWQKLNPAERTQFGNAQQAKAALTKAVKLIDKPNRNPINRVKQEV